jgi:hypothetical protein
MPNQFIKKSKNKREKENCKPQSFFHTSNATISSLTLFKSADDDGEPRVEEKTEDNLLSLNTRKKFV